MLPDPVADARRLLDQTVEALAATAGPGAGAGPRWATWSCCAGPSPPDPHHRLGGAPARRPARVHPPTLDRPRAPTTTTTPNLDLDRELENTRVVEFA
jgi:hypothetical protein